MKSTTYIALSLLMNLSCTANQEHTKTANKSIPIALYSDNEASELFDRHIDVTLNYSDTVEGYIARIGISPKRIRFVSMFGGNGQDSWTYMLSDHYFLSIKTFHCTNNYSLLEKAHVKISKVENPGWFPH